VGHSRWGLDEIQGSPVALGAESRTELEALYRVQRDPMVRLVRLMTGSKATAEEVVQEAFLRVAEKVVLVDNPEGYLRTTVVNLTRNHLRRAGFERQLPHPDVVHTSQPEVDEMWAAVCRLPFSQRAVLALRFYEDLSEDEIARTLDCRIGTVKSRLHRGLANLRKGIR
jgi:RNA polymerase sigma-70 factor (sigma-E family)